MANSKRADTRMCRSCGYVNGEERRSCGLCGERLGSGGGVVVQQMRLEGGALRLARACRKPERTRVRRDPRTASAGEEQAGRLAARRRARCRAHAWVGALTCLALLTLLGLPEGVTPLGLLSSAGWSLSLGWPLAFLISRFERGPRGGALCGALLGMCVTAGICYLDSGSLARPVGALLSGALTGAVPGALVGLLAVQDRS